MHCIDDKYKDVLVTGLETEDENSSAFRWENKTVINSFQVLKHNSLENISLKGKGTLDLSNSVNRGNYNSVHINTSSLIENLQQRPSTTLEIAIDEVDLSSYNRVSCWVYPKSVGHQNFYFHFSTIAKDGSSLLHAPSIVPNKWNHVIWELDEFKHAFIKKINITPFIMGTPPEAESNLDFYITDLNFEEVEEDYVLGYDLNDRIAYCHSGYFSKSKKIALAQDITSFEFQVCNENDELVLIEKIKEEETSLGKFKILDFSKIETAGFYYLKVENLSTPLFEISDNPYNESIYKSLNFLKSLRCGDDIKGVHSPCHLNSYSLHPDGRMLPSFGGWHDAGDVSQFEICTAEMAHAILELALSVNKNSLLYNKLLDEAKWGLNWLLRTRFGDGYRALAIHYAVWTDNVTDPNNFNPENPKYKNNMAENGPFENFLAASALAMGHLLFNEIDPTFADWCMRASLDDFKFGKVGYENGIYTKRWGPSADSQVSGAGATAASLLYEITKDEAYLNIAIKYADVIIACQQSTYPLWEKPIRGFFYEDIDHKHLLTYEHRGHEQSPIQGLCNLYQVAPNHPDSCKWLNGINLYKEFVLKTVCYTSPYNFLPGHIYEYDKLNLTRFTIPASVLKEDALTSFKDQIESGIKLDKDVYLRRFPIAIQRRGFHATLLSKTKAISLISKVLKDDELKQLAIDQLEWILGKNPFASSTMYGEGHNYHPLYVAFSRQMIGSLPVGFKTHKNLDLPYWPTSNNAVFKEIWGHTTGKYLWVLADIL